MISVRCLLKRPFLISTIILAFFLISFSFETAHAQSQMPSIKTDRAVYEEPPLPTLPRAGGKFIDPVFGTEILRATDESDGAAPGLGTYYSHWPTFNRNNTKLLIRKGVTGEAIIKDFDPVSFQVGNSRTLPDSLVGGGGPNWESSIWSNKDPNIIYTFSGYYFGGMKLYAFDVTTWSFTLIKDLSFLSGGNDYLKQMYMSADDDVFCWLHQRAGVNDGEPMFYIVYKRSTDKVLFHNPATVFAGGVNEVHVDKSGKWLHIVIATPQADGTGTRILNLENGEYQSFTKAIDHTPGHGDMGTGTIIGFDNYSNSISRRQLDSIHSYQNILLFRNEAGISDWTNDFHGSMLADNEDWITIGTYDDPACVLPESGLFEDEIVQVATDGSQRFRRLLHTRSAIDNFTETTGYWAMPKPTISKDGRFIAYTSNWENSGRYDLFIARIEPAGSLSTISPGPTPTPTPIATPGASPNPTPSLGSEVIWVDDKLPANAKPGVNDESWNWVTSNPSPYSGAFASQSKVAAGLHQQSFAGASETMTVGVGDVLIAYVFMDPSHPPTELMLQWKENEEGWEHRAYWGTDDIVWGDDGTNGRRWMGALPPVGGWVRLEVPAGLVGLEGKTINGLAFTLYGGSATWDRAGKIPEGTASGPTPTPTPIATPTPPIPTATPTATPTPTPTPIPPPLSLGLVASASTLASSLSASASVTENQMAVLVDDIARAYSVFLTEVGRFQSTSQLDSELRAALYFSRAAEALTRMNAPRPSIQNRLEVVAYYLSGAKNTMSGGESVTGSGPSLMVNSVSGTAVIGPAEALSSASFVPILAPAALGTILGDPNQSPLSTQTVYASLSVEGDLPYELNGVSVAIGGRAARLVSVSPSRIHFCVPVGLPVGESEVIVTSQDGYVSRGMTTIAALAPGIFTLNGYGMGDAVVVNAATRTSGEFKVTTPENFGTDKQTRLVIFASGMSSESLNTNLSNDVPFGISFLPNIAESVVVEARTFDNRVFQLPVEFVGPSGRSAGLDQINVRLIGELEGAGTVELTIVVAGHRSNMAMIKIK
jgi:uncharacterized protein (TIGR03437 family)